MRQCLRPGSRRVAESGIIPGGDVTYRPVHAGDTRWCDRRGVLLIALAAFALPAAALHAQTPDVTCVPVAERAGRAFGCFITARQELGRLPARRSTGTSTATPRALPLSAPAVRGRRSSNPSDASGCSLSRRASGALAPDTTSRGSVHCRSSTPTRWPQSTWRVCSNRG